MLKQIQIDEFNRNGVIIAPGVLTGDDLNPVVDEISTWIDHRAQTLFEAGDIQDLHEHEPFETRYGHLVGQSREIGNGMDIMHQRGPAMFEFLHSSKLLDAVSALVGDEITCNPIQHLRSKPPAALEPESSVFHDVPWHQDAGVMMPEAEDSNVVTCWLPLGDATVEMGCLQVLPGVHRNGYLRHQKEGGTTIVPELMPDAPAVDLVCHKGDVIFMTKFTPHSSTPNRSDRCRWSLDLRYQTTGHHSGRTAHPDFVVRSLSNPSSVMRDHDEWCRLWIDAFENPRGFAGHRSE